MVCTSECGCGGCHTGEKPNEKNFGTKLAQDAIGEFKVKRGYSQEEVDLVEMTDNFIAECYKESVDALGAAADIVRKEGISLSSEPMDAHKQKVYKLLRSVIKRIVNASLDSVADTYGLGKIDLAAIAAEGPDGPPSAFKLRAKCGRIELIYG